MVMGWWVGDVGLHWVEEGEYSRPALSNLHSAALVPDAAAVDANASRHLHSPPSLSSSIDRTHDSPFSVDAGRSAGA